MPRGRPQPTCLFGSTKPRWRNDCLQFFTCSAPISISTPDNPDHLLTVHTHDCSPFEGTIHAVATYRDVKVVKGGNDRFKITRDDVATVCRAMAEGPKLDGKAKHGQRPWGTEDDMATLLDLDNLMQHVEQAPGKSFSPILQVVPYARLKYAGRKYSVRLERLWT